MAQRTLSPGEVLEQAPMRPDEYVQNLNVHLICPQCRETPPNLVEEFSAGDIICASCGLVLQSRVNRAPSPERSATLAFLERDVKDCAK